MFTIVCAYVNTQYLTSQILSDVSVGTNLESIPTPSFYMEEAKAQRTEVTCLNVHSYSKVKVQLCLCLPLSELLQNTVLASDKHI